MSDWRPIETAPKDGTRVLGVIGGRPGISPGIVVEMEFHANKGLWFRPMQCGITVDPTEWMPLPEPPGV